MKLKYKKDVDEEKVKGVSDVTVADLVEDLGEDVLLEFYEKNEVDAICEKLHNFKPKGLEQYLEAIRGYKKFNTFKDLNDATVENVQAKRFEIRNAINTVIEIKCKFSEYKLVWKNMYDILQTVYDRNRDSYYLSDGVKELKNESLRNAYVNGELNNLVVLIKKFEIYMSKFKQVEDEIKETLLYLQDLVEENSRVQSAIVIALDTGELERTFWKT